MCKKCVNLRKMVEKKVFKDFFAYLIYVGDFPYKIILGGFIMLNQIILIGRTVRDVEVKIAPNGRPFAIVTMAVQRSFRNQQTNVYDTDFIDVSLWGATAENVAKYAGKGSAISVRGRVANRTTDIPGHPTLRSAGVVAEQVAFIKTKAPGVVVVKDDASKNDDEENLIDGKTFDNLPSSEAFDEEIQMDENGIVIEEEHTDESGVVLEEEQVVS